MEVMSVKRRINNVLIMSVVILAMSVFTVGSAFAQDVYSGNPITKIVKAASPAVVNIDTETMVRRSVSPFANDPFFREFFGEQFKEFSRIVPMRGKGSGFIVSKDGRVLTNNHVVADADKITVTLSDGRTLDAEIVGKDPTFDLAVLKIDAKDLPMLELGDSDDAEVGEWVIAIGNPFGLEHTVTVGVVSAKNRSIHARDVSFDGFLQTDAAINPGNSGGPLLNLDGKVIGINTAIVPYAQGIGFAIPVNMARQVMDDIVKYGKVKRGWLGVYIQPLTKEFADAYDIKSDGGAVVSDVVPDSPAAKSGLQRADVIVKIEGKPVKDSRDMVFKIRQHMAGEKVKLEVVRRGEKISVVVTLGEVSSSDETSENGDGTKLIKQLGMEVSKISPQLKSKYDLPNNEGLVITSVGEASIAARYGLREGDMILEANGVRLKEMSQLNKVVTRSKKNLVMLIWRDGRTFFLSIGL